MQPTERPPVEHLILVKRMDCTIGDYFQDQKLELTYLIYTNIEVRQNEETEAYVLNERTN